MGKRSGAHALVETLLAEGVTTLFGIPGVATLGVYDAFLDHRGLRHIEVRHEQAAVFMADGYGRATGQIGVALTSGGPGALNTLTAMATSFNDSVPVLHVTNENPAPVRRKMKGYFHDISDQFGVFRPVSGFAVQAALADDIPIAIHQAMNALRNRRPRPALVEIAAEALTDETETESPTPSVAVARRPADAQVRTAAAALAGAERPVVWVGGGVAASGASDELVRLVEWMGAPVITSQKGKGAIPADHPLHIGNWANERPVRDLLASSDALLAVGTRFSYFPTGGWTLRLPDSLVQIDLDPAEIGRNYPATVGVVADARLAMAAVRQAMEDLGYGGRPSRHADVADVARRIRTAVGSPPEIDVLDQMRDALPRSAMVFNDPTTIAFWARSHWPSYEPRTWTVPSGFGTLGFALPAAIGAKVARPDDPSVAVIGDAGVMFTIQDLMTAVQERIPVIVMVFNDEGYGVERRHQEHLFGRHSGVDIEPPDFVALANAFGARGVRVDDLAKVGNTLADALDAEGPVVIEVPNRFRHPGYGSFVDWGRESPATGPDERS